MTNRIAMISLLLLSRATDCGFQYADRMPEQDWQAMQDC